MGRKTPRTGKITSGFSTDITSGFLVTITSGFSADITSGFLRKITSGFLIIFIMENFKVLSPNFIPVKIIVLNSRDFTVL
jgi:hypothetical protein